MDNGLTPLMANSLYLNAVVGTLASSVASGAATSFVLNTGQGANFGPIASGQYIPAVVVDTSTSPETVKEYVYVTAVSGDTLTVTRAAEDSARFPAGAFASGLTVAATSTAQSLAVATNYLAPAGAAYETFPNGVGQSNTASNVAASGVLFLVAIALPAGFPIRTISFCSGGTAAVSPTHWWFSLADSSRVQLATTADQTTTAWAANTTKSLAVATIASGAASVYRTTYTGLHYLGFCMAAGTSVNLPVIQIASAVAAGPPILCGTIAGALTAPPTFPTTYGAITTGTVRPYAWVGS